MKKIIFILIAGTLILQSHVTMAAGNPENGEKLSARCSMCHGSDGFSRIKFIPSLAGQNERYLFDQLQVFFEGKRSGGPGMDMLIENFSSQDMADVASYYSKLSVCRE